MNRADEVNQTNRAIQGKSFTIQAKVCGYVCNIPGQMYNSRLFGGVKMLIGIVKCKDNWQLISLILVSSGPNIDILFTKA